MIFRRKLKANSKNEEPLVPHGLIWQATAAASPQPVPSSSTPISPSPKPDRPTETKGDRLASTRKLGAISPPIPWPSPMVQGIARRPHSQIETERVAAIALGQLASVQYREKPQIAPALVPKPETAPLRVLETPIVPSLPVPFSVAPPSPVSAPVRAPGPVAPPAPLLALASAPAAAPVPFTAPRPIAVPAPDIAAVANVAVVRVPDAEVVSAPVGKQHPGFRERFQAAAKTWTGASRKLAANLGTLKAGLRVSDRIRHAVEFLKPPVQGALLIRRRLKPARIALRMYAGKAREKLLSIGHAASRRIDKWWQSSAQAASKVSDHKIRVAVDAGGWSRLRTRFQAMPNARSPKPLRLKFDSRLWTSMAMAAISAGMTLALISLVRRYGPEGAAATTRGSLASSARPAEAVKHAAALPHPPSSQPAAPARANRSSQASVLAAKKIQHRKRKGYNDDADYVARDTYVYYGPKGKSDH
jgi:hypothetical protein